MAHSRGDGDIWGYIPQVYMGLGTSGRDLVDGQVISMRD